MLKHIGHCVLASILALLAAALPCMGKGKVQFTQFADDVSTGGALPGTGRPPSPGKPPRNCDSGWPEDPSATDDVLTSMEFSDPVVFPRMEYTLRQTDLTIPGRGMDFVFTRTYRHMGPASRHTYTSRSFYCLDNSYFPGHRAGPIGYDWDHSYNIFLVERSDCDLYNPHSHSTYYELHDGTGRAYPFRTGPGLPAGIYESPYMSARLIVQTCGNQSNCVPFTLELANQTKVEFLPKSTGWVYPLVDCENAQFADGSMTDTYDLQPVARAAAIVDANGNRISFEYETVDLFFPPDVNGNPWVPSEEDPCGLYCWVCCATSPCCQFWPFEQTWGYCDSSSACPEKPPYPTPNQPLLPFGDRLRVKRLAHITDTVGRQIHFVYRTNAPEQIWKICVPLNSNATSCADAPEKLEIEYEYYSAYTAPNPNPNGEYGQAFDLKSVTLPEVKSSSGEFVGVPSSHFDAASLGGPPKWRFAYWLPYYYPGTDYWSERGTRPLYSITAPGETTPRFTQQAGYYRDGQVSDEDGPAYSIVRQYTYNEPGGDPGVYVYNIQKPPETVTDKLKNGDDWEIRVSVRNRAGQFKDLDFDSTGYLRRLTRFVGLDTSTPPGIVSPIPEIPVWQGVPANRTRVRPTCGQVGGEPNAYVDEYEYNTDARLTKQYHSSGEVDIYAYDDSVSGGQRPAIERGKLKQRTRLPAVPTSEQSSCSVVPIATVPTNTTYSETRLYDGGPGGGGGGCCGASSPTKLQDRLGNWEERSYDGHGNVLTIKKLLPGQVPGGTAASIESFSYNVYGQLETHTYPSNGTIARVDRYEYYTASEVGSGGVAGALKRTTTNYQPNQSYTQPADSDINIATSYEYDYLGHLIKTTDARGTITASTVDQRGQTIITETRDASNTLLVRTEQWFDLRGNVIRRDTANLDATGTPVSNNPLWTSFYGYDNFDHQTWECHEVVSTDVGASLVYTAFNTNANFASTRTVYDVADRVIARYSAEAVAGREPGNVVQFQYDEQSRLYRQIFGQEPGNPNSKPLMITQTDYDWRGRVARTSTLYPTVTNGIADWNTIDWSKSRTEKLGYNTMGRLVRRELPLGRYMLYEYDADAKMTREQFFGDNGYGQSNRLLAESSWTYDESGREKTHTQQWFDASQSSGNVALGNGSLTSSTDYFPDGSVQKRTDSGGGYVLYAYDGAGRLQTTTDHAGNSRAFKYDRTGGQIRITSTDRSTIDQSTQQFLTEFVRDGVGRTFQQKDYIQIDTPPAAATARVQQFAYDGRGALLQSIDAYGNAVNYQYDGLGRQTKVSREMRVGGVGTGALLNPASIDTTQQFDANSRLIAQIDANNHATRYVYDALNRLIITRNEDGTLDQIGQGATWASGVTSPTLTSFVSGYDPLGDVMLLDTANHYRIDQVTDLAGRTTSRNITRDAGWGNMIGTSSESYVFDGLGRAIHARNDNTLVSRRYDSLGRLLSEQFNLAPGSTQTACDPNDLLVAYGFASTGRLSQITYPGGRQVAYDIDALGRTLTIKTPLGNNQFDVMASFDYAGPSRMLRRQFKNGITTSYIYDGLVGVQNDAGDLGRGRIRQIQHALQQGQTSSVVDEWNLTWDARDNKIGRFRAEPWRPGTPPPTVAGVFTYDSISRLYTGETTGNSLLARSQRYNLDGVHNRTDVQSLDLNNPSRPVIGTDNYTMYSFDATVNQYTYSGAGQYQYDDGGNMIVDSDACKADFNWDHLINTADLTLLLTFFGRSTTSSPPLPPDSPEDINGDGIVNTADLTQLLLRFGQACSYRTLDYDYRNRLVAYTSYGQTSGTTWNQDRHEYRYDVFGRRIEKKIFVGQSRERTTQNYFSDRWQVLEERSGSGAGAGATVATYVYSGGYIDDVVTMRRDLPASGLAPITVSGQPVSTPDLYYHTDDLFNVTSITDSAGAVQERYDYLDYGAVIVMAPDGTLRTPPESDPTLKSLVGNSRTFTSLEMDYDSGLVCARTRELNPLLGRFSARDAIGTWADRLNLGSSLSYVASGPTKWLDPQGQGCQEACTSGCPRVKVYVPYLLVPIDRVPDPSCKARCNALCAGKAACSSCAPAQGMVAWGGKNYIQKSGTTPYNLTPGVSDFAMQIDVVGERPGCCQNFGVVQFFRTKSRSATGWGPWTIDDGHWGGGGDISPDAPLFTAPGRMGGPSGPQTIFFDDRPGAPNTNFEFRILVLCMEGKLAGHRYGHYSWSVGTIDVGNDSTNTGGRTFAPPQGGEGWPIDLGDFPFGD